MVSTASCAPPHNGSPLAITSILLSSCRLMWSRLRSLRRVVVVTRARTHANPRNAHTQNFSVPDGAGSWSSPSRQGAGGARKQQPSSASWPREKPEQFPTSVAKLLRLPSPHVGQPSSPMQPNMRSRPVSWT